MAYKCHRQYIPTDIKEVNKRMQKIRYTKKFMLLWQLLVKHKIIYQNGYENTYFYNKWISFFISKKKSIYCIYVSDFVYNYEIQLYSQKNFLLNINFLTATTYIIIFLCFTILLILTNVKICQITRLTSGKHREYAASLTAREYNS